MAKVLFRQKAIIDLNDIWEYTFQNWSEKQADNYYEILKLVCKEIGHNPQLGKEYFYIRENLFGLKAGKHIIFYHLILENQIEVIRILHERMDFKNRLTE